jgi:hypothetical protein
MDFLLDERLFAEETGEPFENRRGHVGMRRRVWTSLNEQVTVFLEEILIYRATAVIEEGLLVGPGGVVDQHIAL